MLLTFCLGTGNLTVIYMLDNFYKDTNVYSVMYKLVIWTLLPLPSSPNTILPWAKRVYGEAIIIPFAPNDSAIIACLVEEQLSVKSSRITMKVGLDNLVKVEFNLHSVVLTCNKLKDWALS